MGFCEDITVLEAEEHVKVQESTPKATSVSGGASKTTGRSDQNAKIGNPVLAEWLASHPIRAWARLTPALAKLDLRPYLFVTKDRKDYFGATTVLGRLAVVAEKLLGPKIVVQPLEAELRQLAPLEAAQVFEVVRGRVMGGDVFDMEPQGIAGLTVLVKAHTILQPNMLDLLEALPAERCGPWPVSGWEGVIKDPESSARFDRLLSTWSDSGNAMLKTAAAATLRTRKGGR